MKESLEILNIGSSGLETVDSIGPRKKNDDDVSLELEKLSLEEQEAHLRKLLEKKPHGFVQSKRLLASIVKEKDLKLAFDMVMSACLSDPIDRENYLALAEIAYQNRAWSVTKEALEIVKWLTVARKKDPTEKTNDLYLDAVNKINKKEFDSSKNDFWCNRSPDKFWILEKLYLQAETEKLISYSFTLLDIFPNNINNYNAVYKALTVSKNKEGIDKFTHYVKENFKDDNLNKNLFLGMICYFLNDFSTSTSHLKEALKSNVLNPKVLFYLALNNLLTSNVQGFKSTFEMIIPETEPQFSALYFIYSAITKIDTGKNEFPNHKIIASEVSKIIKKLIENNKAELANSIEEQFKTLNYKLALPYYPLYLSEMYIKRKELKKAKDLLEGCSDYEVHRLNAWIYRLEGKDDLAEVELCEYRKHWIPEKEKGIYCQAVELDLPKQTSGDTGEIFGNLKSAYDQTKDLIKEFDLEYGLSGTTCMEAKCQDCCKRTFPLATYTEYLYQKEWLDKQPAEFKTKVYEESRKIADLYKERFNKEPTFIVGDGIPFTTEYPLNFFFSCPFLGDNKCDSYEARPFACRAYGFSTHDGVTFKGCSYFFEQFKSATKLNHIRKVVDATSFYKYSKMTDEKLIGEKVSAPLPIWFAQDYEATVKKVQKAISDSKTKA